MDLRFGRRSLVRQENVFSHVAEETTMVSAKLKEEMLLCTAKSAAQYPGTAYGSDVCASRPCWYPLHLLGSVSN